MCVQESGDDVGAVLGIGGDVGCVWCARVCACCAGAGSGRLIASTLQGVLRWSGVAELATYDCSHGERGRRELGLWAVCAGVWEGEEGGAGACVWRGMCGRRSVRARDVEVGETEEEAAESRPVMGIASTGTHFWSVVVMVDVVQRAPRAAWLRAWSSMRVVIRGRTCRGLGVGMCAAGVCSSCRGGWKGMLVMERGLVCMFVCATDLGAVCSGCLCPAIASGRGPGCLWA